MTSTQNGDKTTYLDALIVGAGFSGLYMLHRLREAGFATRVFEAADNVGGTWYWNRYPGARCDVESIYYNYTFSEELLDEWTWSSKYAEQPEILSYINYVADKFDLRKDIQFKTRVQTAVFDEKTNRWNVQLSNGESVSAQYFITAVGCLSASNVPKFKGLEHFKGEWYHTGLWPHEGVDFKGKHVGVIGTGSSGIQAIPVIAQKAEQLTVFQRTPQYSIPAHNEANDPEYLKEVRENFSDIRTKMRQSLVGIPISPGEKSALEVTEEERNKTFEEAWKKGGLLAFSYAYNDLTLSAEANETVASFIREKIREIVKDPETAEKLLPDYFYATKRPIIDTNYFETYNRKNVSLIDVKKAIQHKELNFNNPLPETEALMKLMHEVKPDFMYSLHNAGFGGAYWYVSHDLPELYDNLRHTAEKQSIPLNLGESEEPFIKKFSPAVFKTMAIGEAYDFMEEYSGETPKIKNGTSSADYVSTIKEDCVTLLTELPYFFDPQIEDQREGELTRKEAILGSVKQSQAHFRELDKLLIDVRPNVSEDNPFVKFVEEVIHHILEGSEARIKWAESNPEFEKTATVAEIFDNLKAIKFYNGLYLGLTVRACEYELERLQHENNSVEAAVEKLKETCEKSEDLLKQYCRELENELNYEVIPIQKLVRIQLESGLIVSDYLHGQRR